MAWLLIGNILSTAFKPEGGSVSEFSFDTVLAVNVSPSSINAYLPST